MILANRVYPHQIVVGTINDKIKVIDYWENKGVREHNLLIYNSSGDSISVSATINSSDPYVTFVDNTASSYPDIPGGSANANDDDHDFAVGPDTPDGHIIPFDLDIAASNGGPWSDAFDLAVGASKLRRRHKRPKEPGVI